MTDVANGDHPTRPSSYGDLFDRLDRIEDKLDRRLDSLDGKVDRVDLKVDIATSRIDRLEGRLEGSLGLVKWLGPAGIAALIFGLLQAQGLI
jgi:hypothetical protein